VALRAVPVPTSSSRRENPGAKADQRYTLQCQGHVVVKSVRFDLTNIRGYPYYGNNEYPGRDSVVGLVKWPVEDAVFPVSEPVREVLRENPKLS
jgi:hypothetical protein